MIVPLGDVIDTVGAVLSTVKVDVPDEVEVFPATSANVAETVQAPSLNPERRHEPDELDTAPEHVTVVPPFVAVTLMVPVDSGAATVTETLVLVVRASLELDPVSDAVAITGAFGAFGAVRSMVNCVPV